MREREKNRIGIKMKICYERRAVLGLALLFSRVGACFFSISTESLKFAGHGASCDGFFPSSAAAAAVFLLVHSADM